MCNQQAILCFAWILLVSYVLHRISSTIILAFDRGEDLHSVIWTETTLSTANAAHSRKRWVFGGVCVDDTGLAALSVCFTSRRHPWRPQPSLLRSHENHQGPVSDLAALLRTHAASHILEIRSGLRMFLHRC